MAIQPWSITQRASKMEQQESRQYVEEYLNFWDAKGRGRDSSRFFASEHLHTWSDLTQTIPIPDFKSVQQVEQNAGAMRFGPLMLGQKDQIEKMLTPAEKA